jgi:prevent-host-death family protein
MPAVRFEIDEADERLEELIDRAEAGEEVIITREGVAVMRLTPVSLPGPSSEGSESKP